MIDIIEAPDGMDMGVLDTQIPRATNILSVQIGSLEYAPDFGIDLAFFLSEDFRFQNESFKAYLIESLANRGINVASLAETIHELYSNFIFNLTPEESGGGMITR